VGAVRIVRETGKPVAQVAWGVGIHEGPTLGNGVNEDRIDRRETEGVAPRPTRHIARRTIGPVLWAVAAQLTAWLVPGAADTLVGPKTNQLWRGLMLASLVETETNALGRLLVVSTDDDRTARDAVDAVRLQLTDPRRLEFISIETFVAAGDSHGDPALDIWARDFGHRYIPLASQ
jgi:hypothetical protein